MLVIRFCKKDTGVGFVAFMYINAIRPAPLAYPSTTLEFFPTNRLSKVKTDQKGLLYRCNECESKNSSQLVLISCKCCSKTHSAVSDIHCTKATMTRAQIRLDGAL